MNTNTLQTLFALAVAAATFAAPVRGQDVPADPDTTGQAETVFPQAGEVTAPPNGLPDNAGNGLMYQDGQPLTNQQFGGPQGPFGPGDMPPSNMGPMMSGNPANRYIYTRIGVMFMDRSVSREVAFTSLGVFGPRVLSTKTLDFEFETASKFVLGVPLNEEWRFEATYFGLQNWEEEFAFQTSGFGLYSVFSNFGLVPADAVFDGDPSNNGFRDTDRSNIQAISYNSHLDNAELNIDHRLCCTPHGEIWLIHGFRYVRLQEGFDYFTAGADLDDLDDNQDPEDEPEGGDGDDGVQDTSLSRVRTDNDLIGFQLGACASIFAFGNFRVDADYKAGIYVSLGEQTTQTDAVINGVLQEEARDDSLAFVSDASLTGTYDATSWLSMFAGYHVLGIDGVALAPENFNFGTPGSVFRIPPRIDQHGQVLYHGAVVGLEVRW